ncbi:membrane protein [Lactococcus hodotermopsidis]|uniref:Membrane protein n=1 Tax=Pseudolactococcus hodotermopsidis TaxID=2709157 RepID=A0A6A0BCN5_9LACT|nr:ECF transporter S component [Lactococcus hodotermopsidis]GFH41577.1 membrane protein [Lactococcus hodotermopsidis]
MTKKNLFTFKISPALFILIPLGVVINYLGGMLKIPLWLESIGTVLSALLAGPIVGAFVGMLNNMIYGLTQNPISFVYALTQIGVGITAGIFARLGYFKKLSTTIFSGMAIGLVSVLISTPLDIIFWGGETGNVWGDKVFDALLSSNQPLWLASFLDELVIGFPDKVLVAVIAFLIYKCLPEKIIVLYEEN